MKRELLNYLICPECKSEKNKLSLHIFREARLYKDNASEVKDGLLSCECGSWFPVVEFIPRMVTAGVRDSHNDFIKRYKNEFIRVGVACFSPHIKNKHSFDTRIQVKDSYNYKWRIWPSSIYGKEITSFYDEWFMKKLGLPSKGKFNDYFKGFRLVLDAGTGLGTKLGTIAKRTWGEVIGVDLSGVEYALKNNRIYPNVSVVQADIFNLPFRKGLFDFIVSDGVLHHTPDAKKSLLFLTQLLRKGGKISIHVYKRMGPIREFTDDLLRGMATKLSPRECYKFCVPFTQLGKDLHGMKATIKVSKDIKPLEIKKGTYDLQRFIYYTFFQCFWNPELNFKENNIINYDWFHPVNASRHYEKEVLSWFKSAKFRSVQSFKTNLSGVSAVGIK